MGVTRLLLAVSVLLAHTGVQALIGGVLAVQIFFMISGYLISFLLTEAKTYSRTSDFYINRALRILPLYWVVASFALVVHLVESFFFGRSAFFSTFSEMPPLAWYFVGVSNFTVLGQDQVLFMSVQDATLQYSADFASSEVQLWQGLLIPPAWSLGVELAFYLVAPFVLLSKKRLMVFFALSLALRALFVFLGFGMNDPWSYRFFPTELAVFLAGAISHQFIAPRVASIAKNSQGLIALIPVVASISIIVLIPALQVSKGPKTLLVLAFFLVALPFLFHFQKHRKLDNLLANLSYPFYILHWLVIDILRIAFPGLQIGGFGFTILALVVTLALSWISVRFVEVPVEKLRRKYRSREL
jgi:peptidoglycan/LPS O-acetylase OafA/YrhL